MLKPESIDQIRDLHSKIDQIDDEIELAVKKIQTLKTKRESLHMHLEAAVVGILPNDPLRESKASARNVIGSGILRIFLSEKDVDPGLQRLFPHND